MDRTEQTGLGLSIAGHAALFAVLSIGLFAATRPVVVPPPAIEIEIVDKVGPTVSVPKPSPTPPAPRTAPDIGPPEDVAPPPVPGIAAPPVPAPHVAPRPQPVPAAARPVPADRPAPARPTPAPAKPVVARPAQPKPSTADTRPRRRPGLDRALVAGLTDRPGAPTVRPTASTAPATRAPIGPAQQSALGRVIREQLKPHWKAPTGADAEQLRTELRVGLARDGSVTDVRVIQTTGITDSNRAQVRLHQEAAMKAVRLASPFTGLPPEYYDAWSTLETVGFDRRLSQ